MKKYQKNLKKLGKVGKYDVWNLDIEVAHFIIPRLKVLKKTSLIPNSFVFQTASDSGHVPLWRHCSTSNDLEQHRAEKKAWSKVLNKMIYSFQAIQKNQFYNEEKTARILEGLFLFVYNLRALWT